MRQPNHADGFAEETGLYDDVLKRARTTTYGYKTRFPKITPEQLAQLWRQASHGDHGAGGCDYCGEAGPLDEERAEDD